MSDANNPFKPPSISQSPRRRDNGGQQSSGGTATGQVRGQTPSGQVSSAPLPPPVASPPTSVGSGFPERFQRLVQGAARVIQGKQESLQLAFVCMIAGGHLLIEDVPGVGKTSLARAMASTVDLRWGRIQFTPDLLPSDVTGVSIYNQATQEFEFRHGPVFANVVVADEINRASPKTQAALLEVMEERTVTVDGTTYTVQHPFMVVATQNPIDLEGTYELPEAQLDRFLMQIEMGYPDADAERDMVTTHLDGMNPSDLPPVMSRNELLSMFEEVRSVEVSTSATDYVVALTSATRVSADVRLGASPRATLALLRAGRVAACAAGRGFVTVDDLKALAPFVLSHRIMVTPEAELQGVTSVEVVRRALDAVPAPRSR